MKYIFGPVKSRRLGNSLGINLTPPKACNFDCIYCQLGATRLKTEERKEYVPIEEVIDELKSWLKNNPLEAKNLNYITLSGSGEPTLNKRLGFLISEIKQSSVVPIALITNSSLLSDASLRGELRDVDLIVPSLDAAAQAVFQEINRPASGILIEDIINGLTAFRKEFKGIIWLEVMLVRGVNDDLRLIKKLKEAILKINPDKIQLNSPVRTTAEPDVLAVDKKKLKKIQEILGDKCEII